MNKSVIILLFLTFSILNLSFGQGASTKQAEQIKLVIQELFDGYKAGDSTRVRAVFTVDAHVQSVFSSVDGVDKLSELKTVDTFINYIGGGLENVHDEKIWDMHINADDMLATVWSKYAFFLEEKFIHCGTETFLLRKVNNEWKIFYLVDTRKTTGCKLPPEIKK